MGDEPQPHESRMVTWLVWGQLSYFLLWVPLMIAWRVHLLSNDAQQLLLIANLVLFFGITFRRLPVRPKASIQTSLPVLLALVFYIVSHGTAYAAQDAQDLSEFALGSLRYWYQITLTAPGVDLLWVASFVIAYYSVANLRSPLTFAYLFFFSNLLIPVLEVAVYGIGIGQAVSSGSAVAFTRATRFSSHPNALGAQTLLYAALAYALMRHAKSRTMKAVLACSIAVIAICLFVTFSRGAWIGLAAMIAAAPVFSRAPRRTSKVPAGLAILVLLLAVFIVTFVLLPATRALQKTAVDRLLIWQDALRVFAKHPLVGAGMETKSVTVYIDGVPTGPSHAHNLLLTLLAQGGIIGTALIVWPCALVWRRLRQLGSAGHDTGLRAQALGVVLGLFGVLVHNLAEFSFYFDAVQHFVITMLATVLGAAQQSVPRTPAERP